MSWTVRCPACDTGFVVPAEIDGQELACPACFSPVPLNRPQAAAAASSAPAASRSAATMASSMPVAAVAEPVAVPRAEPIAEQVVCPRCKLHFEPKGGPVAAPTDRPRVLIVEDMEYFKQVARDALADRYEVVIATSNAEANAALAHGGIDLMILDLNLDNGDQGADLLRSLGYKPCPILIYTSADESEMYGEAWEELQLLGADDLVVKGVNITDSLRHKVAGALGQSDEDDTDLD